MLRVLPIALLLPVAAAAFPPPQREVAQIVSPSWADEESRDRAGEAAKVIAITGIKSGQTVADIGAGGGYYTMRLAPVVGPQGLVIAEDIVPRYLDQLKKRVAKAGYKNVRFLLGSPSNPRLPPNSVDTALLIHMYHEIGQPYALLYRLRDALRGDGRIAIVDLDRPTGQHGMPKALLVCEVKAVGYELVTIQDLQPGYIAVFKPGPKVKPSTVKACRG